MTVRQRAERIIRDLYGCPGEKTDTLVGHSMVLALIRRMGLRALSDEAVMHLAVEQERVDRENATQPAKAP